MWQAEHRRCRFVGSCEPPPARGMMWWISSPRAERQPGVWHRPPSRRHTKRTTLGGMSCVARTGVVSEVEPMCCASQRARARPPRHRPRSVRPNLPGDLACSARTHGHQDLKFRSAGGLAVGTGAAEEGLAECGGERVVVEATAVLVGEHRLRLAHPREDLRRIERGTTRSDVAQLRIHGLPVLHLVACEHHEDLLHPRSATLCAARCARARRGNETDRECVASRSQRRRERSASSPRPAGCRRGARRSRAVSCARSPRSTRACRRARRRRARPARSVA